MRQTLCDGYLVIFALAQAVILLMLTPLFTGISRQIRLPVYLPPRAGIWQDYRDIHKMFKRQEVAPTSSGLMFRLMPWVLISSMLVLAIALPLFITVSPFAGGGDPDHPYLSSCPVSFSLLFPGWIPEVRLRESVPVAS